MGDSATLKTLSHALPRIGLTVLLLASITLVPLAHAQSVAGRYDPVADPAADVVIGKARFTVLTPQLLRMEWSASGHFEDRPSLVFLNRRLPVPTFTHTVERRRGESTLHLHTSALDLVYELARGTDNGFTPANLRITVQLDGRAVVWTPGAPDTGNLMGTTRTLDQVNGDKVREPIGPGLISRNGWAVVDDSTTPLFDSDDFSFTAGEKSPLPWAIERPEMTTQEVYQRLKTDESPTASDAVKPIVRQDWYLFGYGHDYKQALGDYVRVAGRIPLPPYFAFGAWYSRYWAYSDQELEDLVQQAHESDVPLDVLVVDMDWHTPFGNDWSVLDASGNRLHWTGYTWNHLLFPAPELFLDKIHNEGLHVTLNLHPASGVQPFEEAYPAMARAMGVDPATKKYIPFDITDRTFVRNYLDILHHPLEKEGVDFWWLDWQQESKTAMPGVTPTWWLNYVHFTDAEREGKRPLIFHRWGGLGNHRYQIGFSGDVISSWASLTFQPWFTATAANVGYAYWSHDIGGHMYGPIAPELYTRWLQFGALSPILRTHTTKNAAAERRVWAYPEPYSNIMRDAYHLRYSLIPYLYTEGRRTYDDWPEQEAAYTSRNEYQLGENLIVAPVAAPADPATGQVHESIWLPPGDWYEWTTGRTLHGPLTFQHAYSLAQIPIFVRAGAILPTAPPMSSTSEKPVDPLILNVFPLASGAQSSYMLYQDSGIDDTYRNGVATRTAITASQAGAILTVSVAPAAGGYPSMLQSRGYEVRLPGDWPPDEVTVNNTLVAYNALSRTGGWHYEGNTLTTVIHVPSTSVQKGITVRVRREVTLMTQRAELEGFPGAMTRLQEAFSAMQSNTPVDTPPDELTDAMQAGDRLSYHPDQAAEIVAHFHQLLPALPNAVTHAESVLQDKRGVQVKSFMMGSYSAAAGASMLEQIRQRDSLATAAVNDAVTCGQTSPAHSAAQSEVDHP
jgi:alpha-glucosidase (family GH31 glycosyl hydrolase)